MPYEHLIHSTHDTLIAFYKATGLDFEEEKLH